MFSRSTAPAHCASGKDSIGRHCRCCPISSSACAGVNTNSSALALLFLAGVAAAVRVVLGLVDADLLVEAIGNTLELVDRGIVLLHLDLLHVGLLLRSQLVAGGRYRGLVLELDAGHVGVDVLVV